jgi:hypothetical protein
MDETRREVKGETRNVRTYLPTEPPSVAQVEDRLEGIGEQRGDVSNSCGLLG